MKIYTYKPSGALVTEIKESDEATNDSMLVKWPETAVHFDSPPVFDIYNAKAKLPDIFGLRNLGYFFSERAADVFRRFDPEGTDYLPIIARGTIGKGQKIEYPYWGIRAKHALECVDESRSVYIAEEWPLGSDQWVYKDIEVLKFKEDVVKNFHHFRIAGWMWESFISEKLALALKALPKNNIYIRPVDEVFRISRYVDYADPLKLRNSRQSYFYAHLLDMQEKGIKVNYRRRNKNDP